MADPKYSVLCEMLKFSDVLFSRGKLNGAYDERIDAWSKISAYAHEVGFTDTVLDQELFRKKYVNRWRENFRVSFFIFVARFVCV